MPEIRLLGLDDIPEYPVTREVMLRYIPEVKEVEVWDIVKGCIEEEMDNAVVATVADARKLYRSAAVAVVNFFLDAPLEYPFLVRSGILRFQTTYRSAKVSMVLLRAKIEGKTFPL